MARLTPNRAEQLMHSGGSPTPTHSQQPDSHTFTPSHIQGVPFEPRIPMGLGASFNRAILKSIGMSLEAGGLYSCIRKVKCFNR